MSDGFDSAKLEVAKWIIPEDVERLQRLGDMLGPILVAHTDVMAEQREQARTWACKLEAQAAALEEALRGLVGAWKVTVGQSTWAQDDAALEAAEAALAMLDPTT